MRLLVIGGTSGTGRRIVEAGLSRGHTVRAMGRSAGDLHRAERLEPFAGDALDRGDVARALEGVDAVVQAVGTRGRPPPWRKITLFSRSTEVLVAAMRRAGLARLVAITGFGAGDSRLALSRIEQIGHGALLGNAYRDKDRQEMTITASGLDWTIVRPTILTDSPPSRRYRVLTAGHWRNGLISRADVADFVLRTVEDGSYLRQAVVLAR